MNPPDEHRDLETATVQVQHLVVALLIAVSMAAGVFAWLVDVVRTSTEYRVAQTLKDSEQDRERERLQNQLHFMCAAIGRERCPTGEIDR